MQDRLKGEHLLLKGMFSDIELHDANHGWFLITRYLVPQIWTPRQVSLCFQVPPGYPGSPPYGFWVSPPIRRLEGGSPPGPPIHNYQEPSPTPFPGTWGKFSWQHDGTWQPGATPMDGTNLLHFALTFSACLSEIQS